MCWIVVYMPQFVQDDLFSLFLAKITININNALIGEIEASTFPHGFWEEIECNLVFV